MTEITDTVDAAPPRRLVRVQEDRWVAGVAAGLGRYFDLSPLVYRIAFAALVLAGGTGLLLYIAAWLVIPHENAEDSIAAESLRKHRDHPWLILGVGALGVAAVVTLSEADVWSGPGNVWLAALLAGAALVWWRLGGRDGRATEAAGQPARAVRPPSLFAPVLGVLLAAAGVIGLVDVLELVDVDWRIVLAGAVVLVGASVALGAATGRRVGTLIPLGVVLLGAFAVAAAAPVSLDAGVGERKERPVAMSDLERRYELAIGSLDLDLSALELPAGRTRVEADLGIGELSVRVPRDAAVEIDAHASFGEVEVLGRRSEGRDSEKLVTAPGAGADAPTLVLEADVGFGALDVRRR